MKPMLAAPSDGLNLRYPILASPKLDGVRALIINGVVMSRSLKPIPNKHVQSLFGIQKLNGLDGELIVGERTAKDVYQKTVSGVMSHEGCPPVTFVIFDDFSCGGTYSARFNKLHERFCSMPRLQFDNCFMLHHQLINNEDALFKHEISFLKSGFEGIMIRDPDGPYKHGRSTLKEGYLLKVKRFIDAEAEITGFTQLMHNFNEQTKDELGHSVRSSKKDGKVALDQLGAFKVKDMKSGIEFDIGTGFTGEQRLTFWHERLMLTGKIVKYKSQPVGVKDKPRFPVFLGFRDKIDL